MATATSDFERRWVIGEVGFCLRVARIESLGTPVDVLVSPDDTILSHGSGASRAIWKSAGLDQEPFEGLLSVGEVFPDVSKTSVARAIHHAVTFDRGTKESIAPGQPLRDLYRQAIDFEGISNALLIATPLLGTGNAGVTIEASALALLEAMEGLQRTEAGRRQVILAVLDAATAFRVESITEEYLNGAAARKAIVGEVIDRMLTANHESMSGIFVSCYENNATIEQLVNLSLLLDHLLQALHAEISDDSSGTSFEPDALLASLIERASSAGTPLPPSLITRCRKASDYTRTLLRLRCSADAVETLAARPLLLAIESTAAYLLRLRDRRLVRNMSTPVSPGSSPDTQTRRAALRAMASRGDGKAGLILARELFDAPDGDHRMAGELLRSLGRLPGIWGICARKQLAFRLMSGSGMPRDLPAGRSLLDELVASGTLDVPASDWTAEALSAALEELRKHESPTRERTGRQRSSSGTGKAEATADVPENALEDSLDGMRPDVGAVRKLHIFLRRILDPDDLAGLVAELRDKRGMKGPDQFVLLEYCVREPDLVALVTKHVSHKELRRELKTLGQEYPLTHAIEDLASKLLHSFGFPSEAAPTGIGQILASILAARNQLQFADHTKITGLVVTVAKSLEGLLQNYIKFLCRAFWNRQADDWLVAHGILKKGETVNKVPLGMLLYCLVHLEKSLDETKDAGALLIKERLGDTKVLPPGMDDLTALRNEFAHFKPEQESADPRQVSLDLHRDKARNFLDKCTSLLEHFLSDSCKTFPVQLLVRDVRIDRWGRKIIAAESDRGGIEHIFIDEHLEPGKVFLMLPLSNPLRVDPIIVYRDKL